MRTPAPRVPCVFATLLLLAATGRADTSDPIAELRAQLWNPPSYPQGALDSDGDGVPDEAELAGWTVALDLFGYGEGALSFKHVDSDPFLVDTDGDGLDDFEERSLSCDPREPDADFDGLTDAAEWHQWLTSPVGVDTDNDARGPDGNQTPNLSLFDGNELSLHHTSPTLADTDGDGRTDYEEIDHVVFSPLIAELPRSEIEPVGELDVQLNVEYAETVGQETEIGQTFSKSESQSDAIGSSHMVGANLSTSFEYGVESATTIGGGLGVPPAISTEQQATVSATWGVALEVSGSKTWSSEQTTTQEAQEAWSQFAKESQSYTETASSGTISVGLVVRNTGPSTYTMKSLGITVLRLTPPLDGSTGPSFATMATLAPDIDAITLAPGEASPVLAVEADDVNADVIKGFLAKPDSLVLQPAYFDLVDENGIDFDFINENAFSRTALVEIDFGGGEIETYRVATNVDRRSNGQLHGITLGDVLQEILGLEKGAPGSNPADGYTVEEKLVESEPGSGRLVPTGLHVLTSLKGNGVVWSGDLEDPAKAFWTVVSKQPGDVVDFESIRLFAGDTVHLIYMVDEDGDGVFAVEEEFYGASDEVEDQDGDGLTDNEEIKEGWLAGVAPKKPLPQPTAGRSLVGQPLLGDAMDPPDTAPGALALYGYPKLVYSDPTEVDSDFDGLDDLAERDAGTDPLYPDTDRDGVDDALDPHPLLPGLRLYARVDGDPLASGTSWSQAVPLERALELAELQNNNKIATDDVVSIWVERGLHVPGDGLDREATFRMVADVAVYGGFYGSETVLGERDAEPLSNQTVLSGDIGAAFIVEDNCYTVVTVPPGCGPETILDGFTITDGYANDPALLPTNGTDPPVFEPGVAGGGVHIDGSNPTLRNLLVYKNQALHGGGLFLRDPPGEALIEDCDVLGNGILFSGWIPSPTIHGWMQGGGGMHYRWTGGAEAGLTFRRTTFEFNAGRFGAGGLVASGPIRMERCLVSHNRSVDFYGPLAAGLTLSDGWITDSEFIGNGTDNGFGEHLSGAICRRLRNGDLGEPPTGPLTLINCRVWDNVSRGNGFGASKSGGGMGEHFNPHPVPPGPLSVINCSFAGNQWGNGSGGLYSGTLARIHNSVFWGNSWGQSGTIGEQLDVPKAISVEFSCIENWHNPPLVSIGVIETDPLFVSLASGDLRLDTGSPCIDAGFNLVDTDVTTPGIQPLPPADLDGNFRIVDASLSGQPVVDMGAYEHQP